jgi:hypothetical protein
MIYILLGLFLGGFITHSLNKIFNVSYRSSTFFPSKGEVLVILGCLVGGSIGLGYGSSLLVHGTHFYNKLLK